MKAFADCDVASLIESQDDLQKYTEKSVDLYRQNKKIKDQQKRKAKRAPNSVEKAASPNDETPAKKQPTP